jgi:glycosyltransferase involved in cell wall biosynthesis
MKIAMLIENPLFFGGGENYIYEISKYFSEFGHSVDIIQLYGFPKTRTFTSSQDLSPSRWRPIPNSKIGYFVYSRMLWLYSFFSVPLVTRQLIKGKYDVVHVNGFGYSSLLISAVAAKRINHSKVFGTLHNDLLRHIDRKIVQVLTPYVDRYIAVSSSIQKAWKTAFNSDPILIPNGVDTSRFNSYVDGSSIRKRLGIEKKYVVLSIGRLSDQKGVKYLIQAAAILKKDIPNLIVLICGRGEDEAYLKKMVKDLKLTETIMFLGYIPNNEVPIFYAACDVFVLPSVFETFTLTLLEALSIGKPTVCTAVGNAKELASQSAINCYIRLVHPADAKDLAKGILWYYENPELSIDNSLKENVTERLKDYSWKRVAIEINGLYEGKCARALLENELPKISLLTFSRNDIDLTIDLIQDMYRVVDQVVLVDSSDKGEYERLVKTRNDKGWSKVDIFHTVALGYCDPLRMFGLKKCKFDNVLYLDSDERINVYLKKDLKYILTVEKEEAFEIRRYGDGKLFTMQTRLYNKRRVLYKGLLHEQPLVEGPIAKLDGKYRIVHFDEKVFKQIYFLIESYTRRITYENLLSRLAEKGIARTLSQLYLRSKGKKIDNELSRIDYIIVLTLENLYWVIKHRQDYRIMSLFLPFTYWDYQSAKIKYFFSVPKDERLIQKRISSDINDSGGVIAYLGTDDEEKLKSLENARQSGATLFINLLRQKDRSLHGNANASKSQCLS